MDPTKCWQEILELAQIILDREQRGQDFDQTDVLLMAELIAELEFWIASEGFLPVQWRGIYWGEKS